MERLITEPPDILALPEYFFVATADENVVASSFRRGKIIEELQKLSSALGCILVGGSIVEQVEKDFYNRSYLLDSGLVIGFYDKIHPYDNEGRGLIKEGIEYKVFDVRGIRIGLLICADVLYRGSFENIRGLRPDLIFVPTTSPYKRNESASVKFARDRRIFARGASISNSIIFKVCASGSIAGHRLQGRSLIASPGKIPWRIEPQFEEKAALIIAELSDDMSAPRLDIMVNHA
jgi:predicted amidohydrolase